MSKYLGSLDPQVRLMGMVAAELAAKYGGKALDFGVWDGDGDGRAWIRQMRTLVQARDADIEGFPRDDGPDQAGPPRSTDLPSPSLSRLPHASAPIRTAVNAKAREVDSDDDSLIGYGSSASSSRAPSPTPSELDEIEKDPTLRTGLPSTSKQRVQRPVYLLNLGLLLRPPPGGAKNKAQDGQEEYERIDMALNYGAELVRRKRNYGTELGLLP